MQVNHFNSHHHEDISLDYCECNICRKINKEQDAAVRQIQKTKPLMNCMIQFLELLPKNYPIAITSTASPREKSFYFNRTGNRLLMVPFTKLTEHFPLATNVILFYPDKSTIAHKYQLMKQDNTYNYIQGYTTKIPLSIHYCRDDKFMDEILEQKLESFVKSMYSNQNFQLSPKQRQFIIWIHKEYKDAIFCKFMSKVICTFIERTKRVSVISAQFEWIIEKIGIIRLNNVKFLESQIKNKILTFQEEYEEKILEKLNQKVPIQIKLFSAILYKSKINRRIENFKSEVRNMFQSEKNKILEKTEKQRVVQSKTQSDDVAKLFLPQLSNYSNLRQVLNDEQKFKKVVLGLEEPKKKHKTTSKYRISVQKETKIIENKYLPRRHHRSKTEVDF